MDSTNQSQLILVYEDYHPLNKKENKNTTQKKKKDKTSHDKKIMERHEQQIQKIKKNTKQK